MLFTVTLISRNVLTSITNCNIRCYRTQGERMVPELSIIMPAYMKGKCIYNTLREDTKILRNLGLKYEIIVI